jgi:hypothetical protein
MDLNHNSESRKRKKKTRPAPDRENKTRSGSAKRVEILRRCQELVCGASGSAAKVFGALRLYENFDGYCWPLVSTLQTKTRINRRKTIFSALHELESLGVLDRGTLVSRIKGRNCPTLYRIGGKVEKLPEKARDLYALVQKRASKSSIREQKIKGGDVAKNATSQRGEVAENATGVGAENATGVGAKSATQKLYREEPPQGTTAADVAVDREVAVADDVGGSESIAKNHHRPPYETTPTKSNDDDLFSPEKNNSRNGNSTKATPNTPTESYKNRIAEFKLEARSKVEAIFPQFERDYLDLELDLSEARSKGKPISTANYFFIALKNACECRVAFEAEINAGSQSTQRRYTEPFSRNEIEAYCGKNVTKLERAAEKFPAIAERFREIAKTLNDLAAAACHAKHIDLEDFERRVTVLEENICALVKREVSNEQISEIRREMDRSLSRYRTKMSREQISKLENQYLAKRLFDAFEVPRLSLFYLT